MPYKPPLPDLHPTIQKVHAVVTTRWHGNAYRPLVFTSLESYFIDTALDNDADAFQVDVGDPDGRYMALGERDNEIRVNLFGVGHEGLSPIFTGIADEAEYQDGGWNLIGRDLSSLAVDSTVLPHRWAKARAWSIVKSQAHDIGFHNTQLARTGIVKKLQYTDGSESYWDFWYRLYRQEKMWLWTLPDGTLVGDKLNYGADPIYYLGDIKAGDGARIQNRVIPVQSVVLTKSTQGRLYEVVVYGSRGQTGFNITADDPTMRKWKKRPRKVMLDTKSRTPNAARRAAWEEIFEGKVGSVEIKVTIPDPGFMIQQDEIARLYIKEIDLLGEYYVVGSRTQGGPDGFIQEVRLRERQYAVSARVPVAPKLNTGEPGTAGSTSLGKALEAAGMPRGWGDYFIKAAKKHHGVMDYSLFLACLMGICHVETGFINERQDGGPGGDHHVWYPFTSKTDPNHPTGAPWTGPGLETRQHYEEKFANEPGVYGISSQMGVGPMQLTSIGLKRQADDMLRAGHRDQYEGGRWHPEFNIMIAAKELQSCVQGTHAVRDVDIWIAVDAYNRGVQGAISYYNAHKTVSQYAQKVRTAVLKTPGYLAQVKAGIQAAQSAGAATVSGKDFINPFPNGWQPTRLDMGWDGTVRQKIVAPFSGTIMFAGPLSGWGSGNHGVVIRSDIALPANLHTNTLYFYEGLVPTVKAGDHVQAGQRIARPARNGYNGIVGNIEWGLAAQAGRGVQAPALASVARTHRSDLVMDFYHWAKNTLHVPGQATDTSNAGYP